MNINLEVRFSTEDNCWVGKAHPIIGDCCHGDTAKETMLQLIQIVNFWITEDKENQ